VSKTIEISRIIISPDRQRADLGDISELAKSIEKHGQLQPIILSRAGNEYTLVAGERRLRAHEMLERTKIEYKELKDLSLLDLKILEYEENAKRKDLTWQERVKAIASIHNARLVQNPKWTLTETARDLSYTKNGEPDSTFVSRVMTVNAYIEDPKILAATSINQAFNEVARREERLLSDISNDILTPKPKPAPLPKPGEPPVPVAPPKELETTIQNLSFLDWAPEYSGERFNFIHCDFPYGVQLQDSDQMGQHQALYDDSPETYFALLRCFAKHLDNFAMPSCHLVFWYSPKFERETREFFRNEIPAFEIQDIPLVWLKTDNRGILSDYKRRPRNITEFAFIGSRGDRLLAKAKSNGYAGPSSTSKLHPSEKSEAMLRYFFEMFIDERSRVLDPTCGGGSALRAADSLNAEFCFGLELDPLHAKNAEVAYANAKRLRLASS
jgi:hypothetical protein